MPRSLRMAGLFAGIGGIELGFQRALGGRVQTELLCEWWEPAQRVLRARFPDVELHPDVRQLKELPSGLDVLAAGFPCTDLSQAGRTAGIRGAQSGLVTNVFAALRLVRRRRRKLPWLLIENVPNMLSLDRGEAMNYLVSELEDLGYRWAYRVVDSRFTGTPQRRRRVLIVASCTEDPRAVLFADDAGGRAESDFLDDAFGFYWTEGRGGLGWAQDAVPTLKGGSTIGIPSPPAIWLPDADPGRKLITPTLGDAEELQGFPRDWTEPAESTAARRSNRWKLVGNAVTVDVAAWVAARIAAPGEFGGRSAPLTRSASWPPAAWGEAGKAWTVSVSEYPILAPYRHLLSVVDPLTAPALSLRGACGFLNRLNQGNLGRHPGFRTDVAEHVDQSLPGRPAMAV